MPDETLEHISEPSLTVRQLRIFSAVARHLSFTEAARRLVMTQPSVSAAVAELERHLRVKLLVRTPRSVSLTSEGQMFLGLADRILWQIQEAQTLMRTPDRTVIGSLSIGTDPTSGTYVMPTLLGGFKARYPLVQVGMEIANRTTVQGGFRDGRFDLVILSGDADFSEVVTVPFMSHELVIVAPADHELLQRRSVRIADLAREPFVLREAGSGIRESLEAVFSEANEPIEPALVLGNNEAIKRAVQHRLGLACMSRLAITDELALGRLGIVNAEGFPIIKTWRIAYESANAPDILPPFLEFIRVYARHFVASGKGTVLAAALQ